MSLDQENHIVCANSQPAVPDQPDLKRHRPGFEDDKSLETHREDGAQLGYQPVTDVHSEDEEREVEIIPDSEVVICVDDAVEPVVTDPKEVGGSEEPAECANLLNQDLSDEEHRVKIPSENIEE